MLTARDFTENNAMAMCSWQYEAPYDIYNYPQWNILKSESQSLANSEKRKLEYYSVFDDDNKFVGFFRLIDNKDYIMTGLGLAPTSCGNGTGKELLTLIIKTAKERYAKTPLRLEVRTFNVRAIKCYEASGFTVINTYSRTTPTGYGDFLLMELPV